MITDGVQVSDKRDNGNCRAVRLVTVTVQVLDSGHMHSNTGGQMMSH